MSGFTNATAFTLSDLIGGSGNSNTTLSLDLFKFMSEHSKDIGALIGMMSYFYWDDNRLAIAGNNSLFPMIGIIGANYLGFNNVLGHVGGMVGGAYVANNYYLRTYGGLNNNEIMYMVGSGILGGYVFDWVYNNFIYKPSPPASA